MAIAPKNSANPNGEAAGDVEDGNVSADEKPDFRATLFESIANHRSEQILEGEDPGADEDEIEPQGSAGEDDDEGEGDGGDAPAAANAADGSDGDEDSGGDGSPAGDSGVEGDEPPAAVTLKDDQLVEVNIDGEIQLLPWSKVKAGVAIEGAARKRLQEANEYRDRVHQEYESRRPQQQQRPEPAAEAAPEPKRQVTEEIDWEGLTRSMQYDDPADSAKQLKAVVEQLRQPTEDAGQPFDPDAIRNSVLSQVRNTIEWEGAMKDLGGEFNDILSDPYLASLAGARANFYLNQELERERRGQPRRPFYDALAQGTDEIRQWAKAQGMKVVSTSEDSADASPDQADRSQNVQVNVNDAQRQQRKVTASGTQPQPRVVRQKRTVPVDGATLPSEVDRSRNAIADIQKGRGQLAG